jgi:hypothetical protein
MSTPGCIKIQAVAGEAGREEAKERRRRQREWKIVREAEMRGFAIAAAEAFGQVRKRGKRARERKRTRRRPPSYPSSMRLYSACPSVSRKNGCTFAILVSLLRSSPQILSASRQEVSP